MSRDEAEVLAARIKAEPGWHAELGQNYFSGAWHVEAWQDDSVDAGTGEHDGYRFRFPVEWLCVRNGLAEEARQAEGDAGIGFGGTPVKR